MSQYFTPPVLEEENAMNEQILVARPTENPTLLEPFSARFLSWTFRWLLAPWLMFLSASVCAVLTFASVQSANLGATMVNLMGAVGFGMVGGLSLWMRRMMAKGK
jgi:hypothetical protein